mmetsp:Transcript_2084/g.3332  ORF Transcript_2084/g.3332 Transcript_2084/m.3332 type:complete len:206 (-) Transcript_2084:34-651(-)
MMNKLLLLCFVFFAVSNAYNFDVAYNREKCFSEEIAYDVLVNGKYSTPSSPISTVHIKVLDTFQQQIFGDTDGTGSFAFTSTSAGVYTFCFNLISTGGQKYVPPARVSFDLKVGVEAEDYDAIAISEHLSPLEVELRKLEDAAAAVNKHMNYMRQREAAMRNTNESTNSRVLWLSFFSMVTLVSLGVWQIIHLKKYFKSRKLIHQ